VNPPLQLLLPLNLTIVVNPRRHRRRRLRRRRCRRRLSAAAPFSSVPIAAAAATTSARDGSLLETRSFIARWKEHDYSMSLIENPTAHRRTEHIEVKYHYVRAAQEKGVIKVMKVHTDLNYSDIMKKATGTGIFCRHVGSLMSGPTAAANAAAAANDPAAKKARRRFPEAASKPGAKRS
jgi:hypothetical protein